MRILLVIGLIVVSFNSKALAGCDPNEDCRRSLGKIKPCGTLLAPKLCEAFTNDPVCEHGKTICRIAVCKDIKDDADKYILSAQTEIKNSWLRSEENAKQFTKSQAEHLQHESEVRSLEKQQKQLMLSLADADKLIESQEKIISLVTQIKEQDFFALQSNESIEKLILQNSSNLELVVYLQALQLAREQDAVLQTSILNFNPTGEIVKLKETLAAQLSEVNIRLAKEKEMSKSTGLEAAEYFFSRGKESNFRDQQALEIQRQEDRKCK